ncbi:MAG: Uma2 family endonuclease [Chloroflexota bacterium]
MSPSYNHSYLTSQIVGHLYKQNNENKYNIHMELTLDINGTDYIPDIAFYEKQPVNFVRDSVKTQTMPILSIEILSLKQSVNDIIDKFEIYFQAGIQSCWLVIPPTQTISVYHDTQKASSYSTGKVIDSAIDLDINIDDIFA